MIAVLHLMDRDTPLEMRDQLVLLVGSDDHIVSVGPIPPTEDRLPAEPIHAPLGLAGATGRHIARRIGPVRLVHAWSARAAHAGKGIAQRQGVPLILSLPGAAPNGCDRWCGEAHLTIPTEASRRRLIQLGIDAARISVLPPAARPIVNAADGRRKIRQQLGLTDDEILMVAPGELIRPMQHKIVCWSHAMLRYVDPTVRLLLPDDGVDRPFVYSFARGAGFIDETYGPFPPSRRSEALAAADLALLVPRDDIGTSILAECLAAGVPTAAFRTPGLAECAGEAVQFATADTPRAAAQAAGPNGAFDRHGLGSPHGR